MLDSTMRVPVPETYGSEYDLADVSFCLIVC